MVFSSKGEEIKTKERNDKHDDVPKEKVKNV
jgi:hypothetical protein